MILTFMSRNLDMLWTFFEDSGRLTFIIKLEQHVMHKLVTNMTTFLNLDLFVFFKKKNFMSAQQFWKLGTFKWFERFSKFIHPFYVWNLLARITHYMWFLMSWVCNLDLESVEFMFVKFITAYQFALFSEIHPGFGKTKHKLCVGVKICHSIMYNDSKYTNFCMFLMSENIGKGPFFVKRRSKIFNKGKKIKKGQHSNLHPPPFWKNWLRPWGSTCVHVNGSYIYAKYNENKFWTFLKWEFTILVMRNEKIFEFMKK